MGIKEDFKPNIPLVVHWDGKIICDILGKEDIDRLPILVSGVCAEQLLYVPKLLEGTGQSIAASVECTINEWNLKDKVKGCVLIQLTQIQDARMVPVFFSNKS